MKIFKRFVLMGLRLQFRCWSRAYSRRVTTRKQPKIPAGQCSPFLLQKSCFFARTDSRFHYAANRIAGRNEGCGVLRERAGSHSVHGCRLLVNKRLSARDAIVRMSEACATSEWATAERRRVLGEYECLQGSQ